MHSNKFGAIGTRLGQHGVAGRSLPLQSGLHQHYLFETELRSKQDRRRHKLMLRNATGNRIAVGIGMALMMLAFIPISRAADPLSTEVSPNRIYETLMILLGLSIVILAGFRSGTRFRISMQDHWPLAGFCIWALLSTAWSPIPILTISKSVQLMTLAAGAAAAAQMLRHYGLSQYSLVNVLAVSLLGVVAISIILNVFIWRHPLPMIGVVSVNGLDPRPRLVFANAHPGTTGDLLALATIALWASSFPPRYKLAGIALLFSLHHLTDARASARALVAALIVMALFKSRMRVRLLATWSFVWLVIAYVAHGSVSWQGNYLRVLDPLLPNNLGTFYDRLDVWMISLDYIRKQPILGYGYYASRAILLQYFPWAGDAHNNYIDILLMLGWPGLILMILTIGQAIITGLRDEVRLLLGATCYTCIASLTGTALLVPELPMLVLLIALFDSALRLRAVVSKRPRQFTRLVTTSRKLSKA